MLACQLVLVPYSSCADISRYKPLSQDCAQATVFTAQNSLDVLSHIFSTRTQRHEGPYLCPCNFNPFNRISQPMFHRNPSAAASFPVSKLTSSANTSEATGTQYPKPRVTMSMPYIKPPKCYVAREQNPLSTNSKNAIFSLYQAQRTARTYNLQHH